MFHDSIFSIRKKSRRTRLHPILNLALACGGSLVLVNCVGGPAEEGPVSPGEGPGEQAVVQDTFLLEKDITQTKGKFVPKGTYILKPNETKEYYIKTSSGPWEFGGLAPTKSTPIETTVSAATGSSKMEVPLENRPCNGVEEIALIAGSSGAGCPSSSHVRINVDLNRGAGGPYIFLCPSHPSACTASVQYVDIQSSANSSDFNANKPTSRSNGILGWGNSNSDMNQGASGNYVWGRYNLFKAGDTSYISGVGATFKDHWWESLPLPSGWQLASDKDLNYGAGGAYVFMMVKRRSI